MRKLFLLIFTCSLITVCLGQNQVLIKFSDGVLQNDGDVNTSGYEEYIKALGTSFSVTNSVEHGTKGGYTPPKKKFSNFNFLHAIGKTSPAFNFYATDYRLIDEVEILFWAPNPNDGTSQLTYQIILENVYITSVSTSTDTECTSCTFGIESISLIYSRITWKNLIYDTEYQSELP